MKQHELKVFSYDEMDKESKSLLIGLAGQIKREKQSGLMAMLEMGKHLSDAQALMSKNGHGNFGKWVESECLISRQSAFNYINAYKGLGLDCKSLLQTITVEAVYKLTSPTAPSDAVKKAKKLAESGVRVTAKVADEILPPKPPSQKTIVVAADEPKGEVVAAAATNGKAKTKDIRDSLKRAIPVALHPVFTTVEEFRSVMDAISKCKTRVDALKKMHGATTIDSQEINRHLDQARSLLRFAMPYTECPKCRRNIKKACPACRGKGWVHEAIFKTSATDTDKTWLMSH